MPRAAMAILLIDYAVAMILRRRMPCERRLICHAAATDIAIA